MLTLLAVGASMEGFAAFAQQAKIWRIGFLALTSSGASITLRRLDALRAGLRELGHSEGKDFVFEFRWADGHYDRLPALAEELVRQNVDMLITYSTPGAMAAKRATQTIPIVLASVGDPVTTGLVDNLARPGTNITGLAMFTPQEMAKRIELLKDAFPQIRTVAALFNPTNPQSGVSAKALETASRKAKVEIHAVNAFTEADFESAFAAMVEKRVEGLAIFEDPVFTAQASKLAALSLRHRLPAVGQVAFAEAGGLIGYGSNQLELFRSTAVFIDRIMKGAKPGDLPIQQSSRFELVVNMNAASALGVSLPKQLIFRADRVIE